MSLARAAVVCQLWRAAASAAPLWRHHLQLEFGLNSGTDTLLRNGVCAETMPNQGSALTEQQLFAALTVSPCEMRRPPDGAMQAA